MLQVICPQLYSAAVRMEEKIPLWCLRAHPLPSLLQATLQQVRVNSVAASHPASEPGNYTHKGSRVLVSREMGQKMRNPKVSGFSHQAEYLQAISNDYFIHLFTYLLNSYYVMGK